VAPSSTLPLLLADKVAGLLPIWPVSSLVIICDGLYINPNPYDYSVQRTTHIFMCKKADERVAIKSSHAETSEG
jgi:hypothetical protein